MGYWIVVVDDDALSLTNAKSLLGDEDMKVSCLRSGRDLLKFTEKNSPDLILLDVMMPEMDGFETYSALRSKEDEAGKAHIPVIFLTGENDSEVERRGLKAGASDFIRKPFNKEVLLSRIRNTIENSKTIEILTEEATVDKLTGFLNKASGTNRVAKLCSESGGALTIMDLDNFKLVNDLFGHDMGDKVLSGFADIVRHNTREGDILSRIGGDEFMAFFENLTDEKSLSSLSERLNDQLTEEAQRLMGEDNGIPLGISIGAVMIPEYGRDYESLFALADSVLYSVKQNGKHGYAIYDQSKEDSEAFGNDLEKEIDRITKIVEERNDKDGALLLGREAFAVAYRFIMRFYKRYGGSSAKVLFSFSSDKGLGDPEFREAVSQFGQIIIGTLRKSDLVMQNRSNQYFILLNESTRFEVEVVIERIISLWKNSGFSDKVSVDYSYKYAD